MINKVLVTRIAVIAIIISLAAALYLDFFRVRAETANKTVEILLDYDELVTLSKANGQPLDMLGARFKEAGATGVVIRERTLQDLEQSGDVLLLSGTALAILALEDDGDTLSGLPAGDSTVILTKDKAVFQDLLSRLQARKEGVHSREKGDTYLISLSLTPKEKEKMGVGFAGVDFSALKKSGLAAVPRLREWSKATPENLEVLAGELRGMPGLILVTFNDPVVAGANNLPLMAEKIAELGVPVGTFEFYNQQGLTSLAGLLGKQVIRVHAISENDMPRYNEPLALERFAIAVGERNIRALYVRFFGLDDPTHALDRNLGYLGQIKATLEGEGFNTGTPSPLPAIPYSRILMFIIGLGVVAAGVLILNRVMPWQWPLALGLLGVLGWLGLLFLSPVLARKAFALLGVVLFPVLGVMVLVREEGRDWKKAVLTLLQMSGLSLAGALIMTGLLADKSFMLKLDSFSGVKAAHVLPLVLAAVYFLYTKNAILKRTQDLLERPVLVKHLAAGALLLATLAVYIIRTGNEGTMLVSSWETTFRSLLDQYLGVRPRTKEFLLGHPAMLAVLYYGYDGRKLALLLLGLIGQISLINTYAHIHTPLVISLIRSFNGLWLGLLLGLALIAAVNLVLKWLPGRLNHE